MPFERPMQDMKNALQEKFPGKNIGLKLLKEFYLPLFKSGYITKLYFKHDWKTSMGARWEHKQAKKLGLEIIYL